MLSNAKSRSIGNQAQTHLYFLAFCYRRSTFVENPLQIHLFLCKTNPICSYAKINATFCLAKDYEENQPSSHPQNKPNSNPIQSQIKPTSKTTVFSQKSPKIPAFSRISITRLNRSYNLSDWTIDRICKTIITKSKRERRNVTIPR